MTQVPAVPTQQGGVPAEMQFTTTGLEDFGMSDAVLPRIKIVQDKGYWIDNLTQSPMQVLRFIPVGLVKQRSLFHPNVGDSGGDSPMCKSTDFTTGYVNLEPPSKEKAFPWHLSGFNPADFPPGPDGAVKLPCDGCQLKEWGSHPTTNTPYCSEQFTMPIYYDTSGTPDGQDWSPAILTLQKSSLKPIKSYLTPFANSGRPAFIAICHGTLALQHRGTVDYSVPTFVKIGESPRERWPEFADQYNEMKAYLTRPPVREDDEAAPEAAPQADNSWGQQPPAQAAQQAPPPPPAAVDPWAQPQQPAAPVQQPPVAQPPAQPAPVAQDPWATPAPAPAAADPWGAPAPAAQAPPAPQQPVAEQPPVAAAPPPPPPPVAPPPPAASPVAAPPVQPVAEQPVAQPPVQPVAEQPVQPVAPAATGQPLPF